MAAGTGITWYQADSDDEVENTDEFQNAGKTASIMVVDASPAMFQPWAENEDIPYRAALKCCQAAWRSKIISNPKDQVAILLSGTEHELNDSGFPNLFLLQEMSEVSVKKIEDLNRITTDDELDGFETTIGSSTDYNMKELFWLAKIIYDDAKVKNFGKKLTYFTCEDNPHRGQDGLRNDTIKKFKDLKNLDFSIVCFKEDFDYTKFYNNLIEDSSFITFPSNLDGLLRIVRMKQRVKRTTYRCNMQVTPLIKIGVGVYSIVRHTPPPKRYKINRRNDEPVTRDVRTFRATSGMTVLRTDQVKMVEVHGERAAFTSSELKETKLQNEAGIKVVAFLNKETFNQFTWFRSDGHFIYPDEERVTGSTEFFTTLLKRCNALEKVILAKVTLAQGRTPKLACLIPSVGGSSGVGGADPTGFYVYYLPFSDELRPITGEVGDGKEAPPDMVETMEKIIKKTTNKSFDLQDVQNPNLQSMWRQIEMKAFNQDDGGGSVLDNDEEFHDFTVPNDAAMQQRIGELCETINMRAATRSNSFAPSYSAVTVKKTAGAPVDMALEFRNNKLERLTCDVLAAFLKARHVDPGFRSRKATLIEKVQEYFSTHDH